MSLARPTIRRGLTLVELLIAIAIVAILAAIVLGVASQAGGVAREAKTKSMVARLHTLLMEKYDDYRTQRVELNTAWDSRNRFQRTAFSGIDYTVLDARILPAADRLAALRELIKFEMPDRWSDLIGGPVPIEPTEIPTSRPGVAIEQTSALYSIYARAYNDMAPNRPSGLPVRNNTITNEPNTREQIRQNQSAECLYLIIMNATGDGEARSLFQETDWGDTDGDGAREFLDGWGNPISFLRWAPGFESDAQLSVTGLQRLGASSPLDGQVTVTDALEDDHDPYDLFRVDTVSQNSQFDDALTAAVGGGGLRGWRMTPLIFSPGPDGESGLFLNEEQVASLDPYDMQSALTDQARRGSLDPEDLEASGDNVHNHQLSTLSRTR